MLNTQHSKQIHPLSSPPGYLLPFHLDLKKLGPETKANSRQPETKLCGRKTDDALYLLRGFVSAERKRELVR
jgi:hypothetical protein